MRFFVLYGIIPDKGYCNFVRVSEIKGVQNLSNTTTPWVCAKKAHTQGVDIMLIVSKHAEGMSLRYAVPKACPYVMMLFLHATCFPPLVLLDCGVRIGARGIGFCGGWR